MDYISNKYAVKCDVLAVGALIKVLATTPPRCGRRALIGGVFNK